VQRVATSVIESTYTNLSDTTFQLPHPLERNTAYRWLLVVHAGTDTSIVRSQGSFLVVDLGMPTATLLYQNFPNPFPAAGRDSTCLWFDLAHEWHIRTELPWVAAVWAVRPEALGPLNLTAAQLTEDLEASRNHGLLNIEKLVEQWTPRIAIPPATIRHYLSSNIHYVLNTDCIRAIERFRQYAAEVDVLPPLPRLRFL